MDARALHASDHVVAIDILGNQHRALMPDMGATRRLARQHEALDVDEALHRPQRVVAARRGDHIELVHLRNRDGSLQLRHAAVASNADVLVPTGHALIANRSHRVGPGVVVGSDDATLAGHHVLGGVEGEAPGAERTDAAISHSSAVRLCSVLDHRRIAGDGHEARHVGGEAEEMNGDHRADASCVVDGVGQQIQIDEVVVVDVDEADPSS